MAVSRTSTSSNGASTKGKRGSKPDAGGSTLESMSELVTNGMASTFASLKDSLTASISGNSEEYLTEAIERLKTAATQLVTWSKRNPVKTAIAAAAVIGVTAFLVSTAKQRGAQAGSSKNGGKRVGTKSSAEDGKDQQDAETGRKPRAERKVMRAKRG